MNRFHYFSLPQKVSIFIFFGIIAICLYGFATNTLAYPYILAARQIQSIRDCTFGSPQFKTTSYGFSFTVPDGYCALPNRLFPADGSVEIVPRAWYFSINEYAKGTIASASRASVLFEPVTPVRDPARIVETLVRGHFAEQKNIESTTTPSGIAFTLVNNVLGTDNNRYDWALATHSNGKYFAEIISPSIAGVSVREEVLDSFSVLPRSLADH
jgi:hypothetical protein